MHPGVFAAKDPQRPAVIMGTAGTIVTYAELESRSNQAAWLARRCGLRPGDGMAVIAELDLTADRLDQLASEHVI